MIADDARDRALLGAHLAGDRQAFGTLAGLHRSRLWAVAVRTLDDPHEAEDAVQDALLSAYRGAAGYRGTAQVGTWLHRILVNACLDRLRRRQTRRAVPLPSGDREPAAVRDPLAEREAAVVVQAALDGLPVEQRLAIVLVDLQGMPVEEAARVLEIPSGTVKSRCSRGRAALAVALGALRPDGPPNAAPMTPAGGAAPDRTGAP